LVDVGDGGLAEEGGDADQSDAPDSAVADADADDADASDADADAPDAPPDSTLLDVIEPDAPDAQAEPDAPPDGPTGPNVCGDGWRDPIHEECDDGLDPASTEDRACTSSCLVLDRLASSDAAARERRLGAGRHPVAAGPNGHAAVMVELVGEAGDEARVVVHTFTPVGVRVGSASWPDVPLAADPVVAALPGGGFAVAYADYGVDGDGLGIALRRVSGDGASVVSAGHANTTTDFSQHSPDILWSGTQLTVAWEDESTIPRRGCTRRFDAQLAPVGPQVCTALGPSVSRMSLGSLQAEAVLSWRQDEPAATSYAIQMPGGTWISDPLDPPWFDETMALAPLDASTMLAVYTDGLGQQWAALIDEQGQELAEPVVLGASRYRPSLAATEAGVYLAWRRPAVPDSGGAWDPVLDELWLQRLSWDGVTLDASAEPIPLPRLPSHQHGDQAMPALAAAPYWPSGAVLAAWDDLTSENYGGEPDHGDVALELIPTPILRTPLAY